jgi:hypothetical protein
LIVVGEEIEALHIHTRVLQLQRGAKAQEQRLYIAKELIQDSDKSDWALKFGLMDEKGLP